MPPNFPSSARVPALKAKPLTAWIPAVSCRLKVPFGVSTVAIPLLLPVARTSAPASIVTLVLARNVTEDACNVLPLFTVTVVSMYFLLALSYSWLPSATSPNPLTEAVFTISLPERSAARGSSKEKSTGSEAAPFWAMTFLALRVNAPPWYPDRGWAFKVPLRTALGAVREKSPPFPAMKERLSLKSPSLRTSAALRTVYPL